RRLSDGGRAGWASLDGGDRDERGAPAGAARVPGAPRDPRPVRIRLRDEVAVRDRTDEAGGLRRLLDPARLVEGSADQDAVAHRRAACEQYRQWPDAHRRGRVGWPA